MFQSLNSFRHSAFDYNLMLIHFPYKASVEDSYSRSEAHRLFGIMAVHQARGRTCPAAS